MNTVSFSRFICVNNTAEIAAGGCLSVYTPSNLGLGGLTAVSVLRGKAKERSYFAHNAAKKGAAIGASNGQIKVEYADFHSHSAFLSGGTINAEDASVLLLRECVIRDSNVQGELPWGVKSAVRQGGAISAVGGHLTLDSCVFHDSHVMPPGGMGACAQFYQETTASTTNFRGGVVAIGEGSFQALDNRVFGARACSGAYVYFAGRGDASSIFDELTDLHAYSAGAYAVIGVQSLMVYDLQARHCRTERAAGIFAVSSSQEMFVTDSLFNNVTVANGE